MGSRLGYPYLGKLPSMGLRLRFGVGLWVPGLRVEGSGFRVWDALTSRALSGW